MSEKEKHEKIGEAVHQYQTVKEKLANLDQRVAKVAEAYRDCALALQQRPDIEWYSVDGDRLKFSCFRRSWDSAHSLLDEAGLIKLLNERENERKAVEAAGRAMKLLGITKLD